MSKIIFKLVSPNPPFSKFKAIVLRLNKTVVSCIVHIHEKKSFQVSFYQDGRGAFPGETRMDASRPPVAPGWTRLVPLWRQDGREASP